MSARKVRKMRVKLRDEQAAIVEGYTGGKVGIAAVPGSGKTFTLAHLAARLIADRRVQGEEEVLIVTFTNSAVNSFQARIAAILEQAHGLLPTVGYRVRTLHGLAHDIVRERPSLVGLTGDFVILDERLTLEIQADVVQQLFSAWEERLSTYFNPDVSYKRARSKLEDDLPALVTAFIKRAKDYRLAPDDLAAALEEAADEDLTLAAFATQAYADYQRSLGYRGAVDFDDLVRLALDALQMDAEYLARLQARWPYILEDEAQDSSHLQEQMLRLLSAERNWVRVGDPNQAINTTFTTADPRFLLEFLQEPDVTERPLSVSGRSAAPIVDLANELVRWAVWEHPVEPMRQAFTLREDGVAPRGVIRLTPPDDPQPNPPEETCLVQLFYDPERKITPEQELEIVAASEEFSLVPWLAEISEWPPEERPTVAVLVPDNSRGFKLTALLKKYDIPYEELLRSTTRTREAVSLLHRLLDFLSKPTDLRKLKRLYLAVQPPERRDEIYADVDLAAVLGDAFKQWSNVEDFLWPSFGEGNLRLPELPEEYAWLRDDLLDFRRKLRRWLEALTLPVDQLVLTVAQDVFTDAADVALAHKIAVLLGSMAQSHADWRLPQFVEELRVISANERRFIGFDDAGVGYAPKPGLVTVATMHAAKGLEWDRVYLMAVNNYSFPSGMPYDQYFGEKWYIRGTLRPLDDGFGGMGGHLSNLNLEAELLAQLEALQSGAPYTEGAATLQGRVAYAQERLRLLYVGMTRARKELIVTWNMGRFWHKGAERENRPALPLLALSEYIG